jgi:hypothetical protein
VASTKLTGSFLVARAVVPRKLQAAKGRVIMISMNTETMTRWGFVPDGLSAVDAEALAHVMAADLSGTAVRLNMLLLGRALAPGSMPNGIRDEVRARLLDRRSWNRRLRGSSPHRRLTHTASGSSQPSSTTGWRTTHDHEHSPLPAGSSCGTSSARVVFAKDGQSPASSVRPE